MYCMACGSRLSHAPPIRCAQCGVEHWRNAKPCAGAVVTHEGRLLLTRRTIEPWQGRWDVPGGFCEAEEHPRDTAVREVLEETGYPIRVTSLLGIWLDDYGALPAWSGQKEVTLNIYYHGVPTGLDPAAPDPAEVSDVRWFPPDELPEPLAFPSHISQVVAAWRGALAAGE
jgi:ADP-ribose pyrophosphatase YjhB (NUDIX family)